MVKRATRKQQKRMTEDMSKTTNVWTDLELDSEDDVSLDETEYQEICQEFQQRFLTRGISVAPPAPLKNATPADVTSELHSQTDSNSRHNQCPVLISSH